MNKKETINNALQYLAIIGLGFFVSLCYVLFIVPNEFAPAGINGIAVMIQYKLGFSVGLLSLIINIPLCVIAFFVVNKKFAIRSFVYVLSYSLFYLLLSSLEVLEDFQYVSNGIDTIYPVIIAGLLIGISSMFVFRLSSSTGGTDIIAKFVNKIYPRLNFFWVIFALNAVVAFISCFVYKEAGGSISYKPACLCIMYSFLISFISDQMMKSGRQAFEFIIITSHPELVEEQIINKLKHSSTRLEGIGSYSKTSKSVLICIVNKHQLMEFEEIIKGCPDTFAYVETANMTIGNFKQIKKTR